jgi:hypothetical protein
MQFREKNALRFDKLFPIFFLVPALAVYGGFYAVNAIIQDGTLSGMQVAFSF